jgi:undecaprenyl-diphosphatase
MNDYLLSILLGVVEGLTEFLPVSSTAHLRLVEGWLQISLKDPYWKTYSVVIQLGAILAVVVYFWNRLMGFARTFPRGANGDKTVLTHPLTLVLVAFVVTAGPAYLLDKKIGDNLESLWVIGASLLIGGVVMAVVDTVCRRPTITDVERVNLPRAVWIGAVQILSAVFPGTSRSMATIAAGQVAGLSRTAALEFSFFLSIPVMFAATGFKLFQAVRGKGFKDGEQLVMDGHRWGVMAVGLIVSFFVAWAVIAWFMAWVRKRGFAPFALYRIVLGVAVLVLAARATADEPPSRPAPATAATTAPADR